MKDPEDKMKKLFLIVMACALSFTALTGCGAGDVGGPGYQSSSQAAENQSQAAETSSQANLDPDDYEANLDGLCKYFEDKGFVNKESKKDINTKLPSTAGTISSSCMSSIPRIWIPTAPVQ